MRNIRIIFISLFFIVGGTACNQQEEQSDKHLEAFTHVDANSLLSPVRFVNIAHRGGSGYAPEHTLFAYEIGEKLNGDYIEIDLQMTKDGHLVAMHDSDVSRTTNGVGEVKDYTLKELKQLDAGSWFNQHNPDYFDTEFIGATVPTLEEIFDTFGQKANYYIETKTPEMYPEMVDSLIETLKKYGFTGPNLPEGKIIIQSFSDKSLLDVHKLAPNLPLIQLLKVDETSSLTENELKHIQSYATGIGINYKALTKELVDEAFQNGLLIHPYTVNRKKDMERLLKWGVDGMFTDYPDLLDEVINIRHKK
ncbi:MAG TPA: glycerophosphodiester phosphodiesterase [Cerasibacillus sp.]|uniref:glycerophosphodiester phosphodiesterase n=1 Tax=Cerasibacillus sp. TaxID=2498711 RepID=UPI002F3FAD58